MQKEATIGTHLLAFCFQIRENGGHRNLHKELPPYSLQQLALHILPLMSQFEEHLNRLKSSEVGSSSSLSHRLNGLQDLHDSTLKLLQLSATQQDLARECSQKSADKLSEGFLFLLDISGKAEEESIQALQSVIRRKRGAETSEFKIEAGNYLASRKKMKQEIRKALRNLEGISKDSSINNDDDTLLMLSILKEAEAVSMSSLETLLFLYLRSKGTTKAENMVIDFQADTA